MKIPKKVVDRFSSNIKNYQNLTQLQKSRDVSEADTVTLVKDMLADMFGYDKYLELTSEQQIRGTYCDLAVKFDGKIKYLIEVKAAGIDLNDSHLRQAINYGSNQGIEWVVLTNSVDWKLYRIKFGQPIDFEEVTSFNISLLNSKNDEDIKKLFLLCKEGLDAGAMGEYHQQVQIFNKYTVAQVLMMEQSISMIRREFKKLFPEIKIDNNDVMDLLVNDVLKRGVIEGDKAKEVQQRIKKAINKLNRNAEKNSAKKNTQTNNANENSTQGEEIAS